MRLFGCCTAITLLALTFAKQEIHRFIHVERDGKSVAQDIIHDQDANTVMVIVGDVSKYSGYIPTVNLHDFNTGFVAFKDIRNKICWLSRTPYPRAMPELYRQGMSNLTMEYTAVVDPTALDASELEDVAGSTISEFCRDYVTFSRQLIPVNHALRRDTPDGDDPCWWGICLFCVVKSVDMPSVSDPVNIVG